MKSGKIYRKIGFKASPISGGIFSLFFFHKSCYHAFEFTINILVTGEQSETKNGLLGKCKISAKVATACETSTLIGSTSRLFPRF